ncbi:hypothetical protein LTR50_006107 [Elasticomyces elasticus]|nr:hypothetical protein LTR50_006107 [Elasticomyces elasticus]
MPDTLPSVEPISSTSWKCKLTFQHVASSQWSAQFASSNALRASFVDAYGRYKIWGGSIGVFQDHDDLALLDQSLKNAWRAARQIAELLCSLEEDLSDFEAIVTGLRENRQGSLYNDLEGSHGGDGSSVPTEHSDDPTSQISEVHEVFMSIDDTVSTLLKLLALIRSPPPRDYFAQASATIEQPSVLSETFDEELIGRENPLLNTAKKKWLKIRLGKANNRRRKFLLYYQQNSERLAAKIDVFKKAGTASDAYATGSTPSIQRDRLAWTVSRTERSDMTTSFVNTAASTLVDNGLVVQAQMSGDEGMSDDEEMSDDEAMSDDEEMSDDEVLQGSYLSESESQESKLSVIPLAQVSQGRTEFTCPYCCLLQTTNTERSWQEHVFSDIKAYMCTSESCELRTFGTSHAWFQHEIETHLVEWQCQYCTLPPFDQLQDFRDHMLSHHDQRFAQSQLLALTRVSQQPADSVSAAACNFCDWSDRIRDVDKHAPNDQVIRVSLARYRAHVGAHLEQIALSMLKTQFSSSERSGSGESQHAPDVATAQEETVPLSDVMLYSAAFQGLEAKVTQLVNDGADVNASEYPGRATPLQAAAENGHYSIVASLCENGADIQGDLRFPSPLHLAAKRGHERMVRMLLDLTEGSIDTQDVNNQTPLSLAAQNGNVAVVRLLLETNKVDSESKDCIFGQTPLSFAAQNGHNAVVRLLLNWGTVDADSKTNATYQTPLSLAAENGHEAVVRLLLGASEVDPDSKSIHAQTPLSLAAYNGHEAVTRLLLDTGRVDLNFKASGAGETPLWCAACRGHEMIVRLLLGTSKVDPDSKNRYALTPLSIAAWHGHEAVVRLLLETSKVDVNSKNNTHGMTPLLLAAWQGHEVVVRLLLETGVDVNSRSDSGETPLSRASQYGYEAVVKLLLETGQVDVNWKSYLGQTPLSLAAKNGHEAVVRLLLESTKVDVDPEDNIGDTPLSLAAREGHEEVVRWLLDRGAEMNSRDHLGQTPLSIAARVGHEATVRVLVDRGAEVNSKNNEGQTPLSLATQFGHEAVIRLLLETDVDVNSSNVEGQTPLWQAILQGHERIVHLLLETDNVDVNLRDDEGQTPLALATLRGHKEIVNLLLETGKVDAASRETWTVCKRQ